MKTKGGREWYQSRGFDKLLVGKCPFPALKGYHHERSIKRQNVSPSEHSKYYVYSVRVLWYIPLSSNYTVGLFLKFISLREWTKDGIAFPRHTLPIVRCLRRIWHMVDYKFGGFFFIIFVHWCLMDFLNFEPAPVGVKYTECQAFQSSKLAPPPPHPQAIVASPPLWFRGGHTRQAGELRGEPIQCGRLERKLGILGILYNPSTF
jgi:hypothetical protein